MALSPSQFLPDSLPPTVIEQTPMAAPMVVPASDEALEVLSSEDGDILDMATQHRPPPRDTEHFDMFSVNGEPAHSLERAEPMAMAPSDAPPAREDQPMEQEREDQQPMQHDAQPPQAEGPPPWPDSQQRDLEHSLAPRE